MSRRLGGGLLIRGASYVQREVFSDRRGALVSFETANMPFEFCRYFIIQTSDSAIVRAEHSSSTEELLVALSGSVLCDVDNGSERATLELSHPARALWLRPGVWLRLHGFAEHTVIGVAASLTYAETRQWPRPMPEVLEAALNDSAMA